MRLIPAVLALLAAMSSIATAAETIVALDAGGYRSVQEARSLWNPIEGSPPIEISRDGALRLPGNFDVNRNWRVAWDQVGSWDFSGCRKIVLDIADNPDRRTPLARMRLYLNSGGGWYYSEFEFARGDCRIELQRKLFRSEGEPIGWHDIRAVRLELRNAAPIAQALHIRGLRVFLSLSPDTAQELYARHERELGQVAGFTSRDALGDAVAANLSDRAGSQERARAILQAADRLVVEARNAAGSRDFERGVQLLRAAQQEYLRSYVASVPGKSGEMRAVWCCDPRGPGAGHTMGLSYQGWDPYIRALAGAGFNAVMPVMSEAGTVAYRSSLLPLAAFNCDGNRDSLAECVAAGRKHGVKVFAAKCNFWLWDKHFYPNDKSLFPNLVAENRLQVTNEGKRVDDHICPSHPENLKLEVATFVELVREYEVDGIVFDFIRYGGPEHCYCSGCRDRFEGRHGLKVGKWPADVFSGPLKEPYRQFRRDSITAVVAAVSREARMVRPGVLIVAAVITDGPTARDALGQDWKLWLEEGYLDVACPMIYTTQKEAFAVSFRADCRWAPPRARLAPGIREDVLPVDQALGQIVAARKAGADGFFLWHYVDPEKYQRFLVPEGAEGTPDE